MLRASPFATPRALADFLIEEAGWALFWPWGLLLLPGLYQLARLGGWQPQEAALTAVFMTNLCAIARSWPLQRLPVATRVWANFFVQLAIFSVIAGTFTSWHDAHGFPAYRPFPNLVLAGLFLLVLVLDFLLDPWFYGPSPETGSSDPRRSPTLSWAGLAKKAVPAIGRAFVVALIALVFSIVCGYVFEATNLAAPEKAILTGLFVALAVTVSMIEKPNMRARGLPFARRLRGAFPRAATRPPTGTDWHPPHPRPKSTTHGDARFADAAIDGSRMQEILGTHGIWLGSERRQGAGLNYDPREVSYSGTKHMLTVAPTGSGKASCAIIPNLLMAKDYSVICIDPKGQIAAVTAWQRGKHGPVYCMNPFGLHTEAPWELPQHAFNPLAHLSIDSPTLVAEVSAIAQALVVTESQTQPYFDNSARDLVEVLILHAIATNGPNATLLDMRAWIGLPYEAPPGDPSLSSIIVEMKNSPHRFIAEAAGRFYSDARSVAEVQQSAANQTRFLSDPNIARTLIRSDFTMAEFKEREATLYVILPDTFLDAYSRFLRLVTISALDGLRTKPGGMKVLVILDEFARLGRLTAVENAFALARGYNVQLWPFVQDLNQLKDVYRDRWQSFIANAGVVQWFTPNDTETAEYLSKRIGKTTVTTRSSNKSTSESDNSGQGANINAGPNSHNSKSFNKGRSTQESRSETTNEAAADWMSPQDLFDLPECYQIITYAGLKYPILATREHYYQWSDAYEAVRLTAMPDPFHMPERSATETNELDS